MEGAWDRGWTSEALWIVSRQMQAVYLFSKVFRGGGGGGGGGEPNNPPPLIFYIKKKGGGV